MFTIGKLASLTGVSNDTLRYYEEEGLIKSAGKSPAGCRLYDQNSARRINFIKHAQRCDFTLPEICELLELRREKTICGDIRTRAIEKKLQIESKLRAIKAMSNALDQLVAECANERQPVREFTIIAVLERAKSRNVGGVKA